MLEFNKSFSSYKGLTINNKSKIECIIDDINLENIPLNSHKKCWFKCDNCPHKFEKKLSEINRGRWCPYCCKPSRTFCEDLNCEHCFKKSFANYEGLTDKDKKKVECLIGEIEPKRISYNSNKKCWFKCDVCDHDFDQTLFNIVKGVWCSYCCIPSTRLCGGCEICNKKSFNSYEELTINGKRKVECLIDKIDPKGICKGSEEKYNFNCDNCPHIFYSSIAHIVKGTWCPYCANKKLCNDSKCLYCFNNSFASFEGLTINGKRKVECWSDKNKNNCQPRNIFKSCNSKFWFKCDNCHHDFDLTLNHLTNIKESRWCPYCCIPCQKICDKDKIDNCEYCFNKTFANFQGKTINGKKIVDCWGNENKLEPKEVLMFSNKKFKFNCPDCNEQKNIILTDISKNGSFCGCQKNKTIKILCNILKDEYKITCEKKYDWCKNNITGRKLPFDIVLEEFKIIIELDGIQHFIQVMNWQSPEDRRKIDIYKQESAIENGYSVIRLLQEDVYFNKNDWKDKLFNKIKIFETPEIIYIDNEKNYYINYKIGI